jgi:hypothetical protein
MEDNKNTNTQVDNGAQDNSQTDEPKTTYSKEEVDALLQAEVDRRITSAQKKWAQQSKKEVEKAKKLAEMDEQQRTAFELESTKAELEALRIEKAKAENTQTTLKVLANRNLPAGLLEYVLTEDEQSTLNNIVEVEKMLKKWVDDEVSRRLPTQGAPKSGSVSGKVTKEEFAKWSLGKQAQLSISNPELYKELTQ